GKPQKNTKILRIKNATELLELPLTDLKFAMLFVRKLPQNYWMLSKMLTKIPQSELCYYLLKDHHRKMEVGHFVVVEIKEPEVIKVMLAKTVTTDLIF